MNQLFLLINHVFSICSFVFSNFIGQALLDSYGKNSDQWRKWFGRQAIK